MEDSKEPRIDLARKVLPKGLFEALGKIFSAGVGNTMLVGGTALAGFYAGHRSSDDLDLFCGDEESFEAAVRALKHLSAAGCELSEQRRTAGYLRAVAAFWKHTFTIDVVLDANSFVVGEARNAGAEIKVASLLTILKMKSSTLVSRASEKDLFDLRWLFASFATMSIGDFLSLGAEIDAGMNAEAVVYVLGTTKLQKSACGFAEDFGTNAAEVYRQVEEFRKTLLRAISEYSHKRRPSGSLADIVQALKPLTKK